MCIEAAIIRQFNLINLLRLRNSIVMTFLSIAFALRLRSFNVHFSHSHFCGFFALQLLIIYGESPLPRVWAIKWDKFLRVRFRLLGIEVAHLAAADNFLNNYFYRSLCVCRCRCVCINTNWDTTNAVFISKNCKTNPGGIPTRNLMSYFWMHFFFSLFYVCVCVSAKRVDLTAISWRK